MFLCSSALNIVVLFFFYFYSYFLLGIWWSYHLHGLTSKLEVLCQFIFLRDKHHVPFEEQFRPCPGYSPNFFSLHLFLFFFGRWCELFSTNQWGYEEVVCMVGMAVMTKKFFSIKIVICFSPKTFQTMATSSFLLERCHQLHWLSDVCIPSFFFSLTHPVLRHYFLSEH